MRRTAHINEDLTMKAYQLLPMQAVAAFYGCSDKNGADGKTSLIEKAGQAGRELGGAIEQRSAEAGDAASDGLNNATQKMGNAVPESATSSAEDVQAQTGSAQDHIASAVDAGKAAVIAAADPATSATTTKLPAKVVETAGLEPAQVDSGIDPAKIAAGKAVYSKHCMACHAGGVAGAPKLSDAAVWKARIAQGMDTLNSHAINGFQGSNGYMPPKGGFTALSDEDVISAVAYMVSVNR